MKLLLDENLSRRIVPFLQNDFPGSSQVVLDGLEQATDQQLWEYARDQGFVIVSKDSDFYELSLLRGTPPKIIWLQIGNSSKSRVTKLLLDNRLAIERLATDPEAACLEIS